MTISDTDIIKLLLYALTGIGSLLWTVLIFMTRRVLGDIERMNERMTQEFRRFDRRITRLETVVLRRRKDFLMDDELDDGSDRGD